MYTWMVIYAYMGTLQESLTTKKINVEVHIIYLLRKL
jgi:hypothetical protein